jgi:hypothetical protein
MASVIKDTHWKLNWWNRNKALFRVPKWIIIGIVPGLILDYAIGSPGVFTVIGFLAGGAYGCYSFWHTLRVTTYRCSDCLNEVHPDALRCGTCQSSLQPSAEVRAT